MSKKKKTFLVLLGISIIASLVYLALKNRQAPIQPAIPTPSVQKKGQLNLLQILPPEGKNQTLFTKTGILFTFDDSLVLSSAEVNIEPTKDIVVELARDDSKTLVVRPVEEWVEGVLYTITVKKGLSSKNKILTENLVYQVEFEIPENINPPSSEF